MASLNGVGVRKVKTYPGHEGESCLYGELVLTTGRKPVAIGTFADDSWGGPMNIRIESTHQDAMNACLGTTYKNEEDLVNDLLALHEWEKNFKSGNKKGFPILLAHHSQELGKGGKWIQGAIICIRDETTLEEIQKEKAGLKIHVFRSLEEFNVNW